MFNPDPANVENRVSF